MTTENAPDRLYCEDCKFCAVPETGLQFARCQNPNASMESNDGFVARVLIAHAFCSVTRGIPAQCGPQAKWFEPKDTLVAAPKGGE